jgi:hypothetical protein
MQVKLSRKTNVNSAYEWKPYLLACRSLGKAVDSHSPAELQQIVQLGQLNGFSKSDGTPQSVTNEDTSVSP